jgi:molybdopterin-guanine dinucleotide biosynthesis protein A
MGGAPKGLLRVDGEPIVARAVRVARELGHEVVLVGRAEAYAEVARGCEVLEDEPAGVGPLGGLGALLARAERSPVAGGAHAIALACDLPYLRAEPLRALVAAASRAAVVAPRRAPGAPWEPLFARYDAVRVRPVLTEALAAGERSFQRLFARLDVDELLLDAASREVLVDWDAPEDLLRGRREP